MSSQPYAGAPAPSQGMSPAVKWLLGCSLGCALLVLCFCGGAFVLGYFGVKPIAEQGQKAEEAQKAGAAAMAKLRSQDEAMPAKLPEDVADAVLTDEDVARYVRVRTELAPQLERVAATEATLVAPTPESFGAKPSVGGIFGGIKGMMAGMAEAHAANSALLEAAAPVLQREGLNTTDLSRLAEIVEWRYLNRPEALALGLPAFRRADLLGTRQELRMMEAWSSEKAEGWKSRGPGKDPQHRAEDRIPGLKKRIEEMEAEARANVTLADATRSALDAHRAELEALAPGGVLSIAPLSEEPVSLRAVEGRHAGMPSDGADGASAGEASGAEGEAQEGAAPESREGEASGATGSSEPTGATGP